MSSQKGNVHKRGPPKHQNKSAFKNDLHDRTPKMKMINSLVLDGICLKCKDVIDWKIKYKKYKPLTVPKKCTKCQQKTVKQAYYIMCVPCASGSNVCAKCGQKSESVTQSSLSMAEQMSQDSQQQTELKMLPERKRRQIIRLQEEGELSKDAITGGYKSMLREDEEEVGSESEEDDVGLLCENSLDSDQENKCSNEICCSGSNENPAKLSVTRTDQISQSESADRKSGSIKETDTCDIIPEVENIAIKSQKQEQASPTDAELSLNSK